MRLLIPGGAGYIGSHMVRIAQDSGHEVVVLDDFSTGNNWAIESCEILKVNLLDKEKLLKILKGRFFDGVIHFAAKSLVAESILDPHLYYTNNVIGSLNLLDAMKKHEINNLVFSSTAAIFGNPKSSKISEDHPKNPINPYGKSKLMVENILEDISYACDLNITCLRYFNAAGASKSGLIGEAHVPETHLIPNILNAAKTNSKKLKIYGTDYDTKDGTCIRDYIHVDDLAQAHLLALKNMMEHKGFFSFNLGNSNGFSVYEVIQACEKITSKKIYYETCNRRKGDPAVLVADSAKANAILGWLPEFNNIEEIVDTAWNWHKKDQNHI